MNAGQNAPGVAVSVADAGLLPRGLRGLPVQESGEIGGCRRLIVVGSDADLAAMLTRLLRAERLDVEVAYVPRRRTRATRIYRLPAGRRAVARALRGSAGRVPLIRDETGTVLVGRAEWVPSDGAVAIRGEAVVDDTVLFDGDVAGVWIEPTPALPGLRAAVTGRWARWVSGRAAQLGTTGAALVRDGVPAPRAVRRSAFYRHVEGWLLVR
ncbi:peptidase M50 [Mycobacterium sp. TY814]|uniref:peptidase M50 n=1 Tax=unclassified Mycobacterium TaxID=2642494 RepID=UPI002740A597|nr:peptidase M50 [Mycobacterium sp. TY814]MDP7722697.1 peptidase M50 [Mycobacterium sp. TY814]